MSDPIKRMVLTRHWIGDTVYHVADGTRGLVLYVSFETIALKVKYFCVFNDRKGEWCEEMELSTEKTFTDVPGSDRAKA